MPGHKGKSFIGCEPSDITEIEGADFLYKPGGIIAESEANAAQLFGAQKTCYSTEGSSQCIRAMLYLALTEKHDNRPPVVVAARNVHKAYIYAAAMLDIETEWLFPKETNSLCSCEISAGQLETKLESLSAPPAAVYVTGVDYLGGMADIASLAEVCHRHDTILIVDNAHGAYLHFLPESLHPLDMGADICCDSAHKTFPVLTGGAYLHISKRLPESYCENAKAAMELFGSTSPSYLIMESLDLCNLYLSQGYSDRLKRCAEQTESVRQRLKENGWETEKSDPLRLTVRAPRSMTGYDIAGLHRKSGIECEYADRAFTVLMATPENSPSDFERLLSALGVNRLEYDEPAALPSAGAERAISVREAFFRPKETVSADSALGRICAAPAVSCPPAVPIAVSGEIIGEEALSLFRYYGIEKVDVVK